VGSRKAQLHVQFPDLQSFSNMLADLNREFMPRLIVMDAIVAMEGNGPMNGKPRACGWLLVGFDPVAIDTVGATIMGFTPGDLKLLKTAQAAGLGTADPRDIEVALLDAGTGATTGEGSLADFSGQLAIPGFVRPAVSRSLMTLATKLAGPLIKRHVMERPAIQPDVCTRCSQCVKACPVDPKALSQNQARAVPLYRYDRCIRCYCCQEICPAGAIVVEPAWPGRMLPVPGRARLETPANKSCLTALASVRALTEERFNLPCLSAKSKSTRNSSSVRSPCTARLHGAVCCQKTNARCARCSSAIQDGSFSPWNFAACATRPRFFQPSE